MTTLAIILTVSLLTRPHPAIRILWHTACPITDWTPHTSTVLR